MNSLVVLLSVVALATAKPSQLFDAGVVAYSAPIVATGPAAVSHQSRLDIKTSPAIVETAAYAPLATRTIISEPTLLSAPAFLAPAAVSSQSRIDIKTTPAISKTVVASSPIVYSAPIATAAVSPALVNTGYIASGISTAGVVPTFVKTLSPAIAAPTLIKSAAFVPAAIDAPVVSLVDTPELALARAGTIETKVIGAGHLLKKRSAPVLATAPVVTYSSAPLISTYGTSPLTYATPINVGTPLITKGYSLHAW